MRLAHLAFLAAVLVMTGTVSQAAAQGGRTGPGRYQPSTPTVSPYLNLLRRDSGRLPNYYSLVRPQQRQENVNRQQQYQLNNQASRVRGLNNQLLQVEQETIRPTGSASMFMNYSHYYQAPATVPGRRR